MRKRWVKAVLVSLLFGAVINIAVAWGLAGLVGVPRPNANSVRMLRDAELEWYRPVPTDWPVRPRQGIRAKWWCCTVTEQDVTWPEPIIGADGLRTPESMEDFRHRSMEHSLRVIEMGLPMRSMGMAWPLSVRSSVSVRPIFLSPQEASLRGGWPLPARYAGPPWRTHVPLNPVWPGLALNTVLYGVIAGALLFGPGCLKRRGRIRRGQCLACGYELAGLAMCPECGVPRSGNEQTADEQMAS